MLSLPTVSSQTLWLKSCADPAVSGQPVVQQEYEMSTLKLEG